MNTGHYELAPVYRNDALRQGQVCPPAQAPYSIHLQGNAQNPDTASGLDFAVEERLCAKLEVSVSSDRRRRCQGNTTTVRFANSGYEGQRGVELHVKLPRYVYFLSASLPYTLSPADSVCHFSLGTLAPMSQGVLIVHDSVACRDNIRGLEVCTRAWLTPEADTCLWPSAYSGARIEVTGRCSLYVPSFTVRNLGTRAMAGPRRLRLFSDSGLVYNRPYDPLSAGDSLVLTIPQGSSLLDKPLTLWAQQDTLSPFGDYATAAAHCLLSLPPQGTASGLFPPRQGHSVEASECQPIRDSYDPNDKQASPLGQGVQHHVEPGTLLSYKIRFMNKGNDTAYTVRVVDTLSNDLDLSTFEQGPVSHGSLRITLSGEGRPVMSWTSRTIKLADSTRSGSEAASGFISFNIRLRPGITPGTVVQNRAHIYFDFNPAVITNTVSRRVYSPAPPAGGGPGDSIVVVSVGKSMVSAAGPRLVPNPATRRVRLEGMDALKGEAGLDLIASDGRLCLSQQVRQGSTIELGTLPKGLYLYRITPLASKAYIGRLVRE